MYRKPAATRRARRRQPQRARLQSASAQAGAQHERMSGLRNYGAPALVSEVPGPTHNFTVHVAFVQTGAPM